MNENIKNKIDNSDQAPKVVFILRHKMPRDQADECNKVFKYLKAIIENKLKSNKVNVEEHVKKI